MTVRCRWCGVRELIFRNDPVKQFVDFVTRPTKSFKQIICMAHNASAFDSQFILRYLVESNNYVEPKFILNGTKIILLTVGQTKFIDSINYMPMRLSMLPKAFGLKGISGKGLFPHLFNTVENQYYTGPLPDIRYFSPDTMKLDEREEFLAWHAEMGYFLTEKWECVFNRELRENQEMRDFVENHPMLRIMPLDPRDTFFGGRTGNIVTRYEVTGDEKIRYVDVCSLYPYVLKTGAFPIGHPEVYVGEECSNLIGVAPDFNFTTVEGLVQCRVLAPRELFHPVLPFRTQACTQENPADREFEGTWVSCELRKAIEKGNRVTSVSEIWNYKISRYDPSTRQGELFAEYINCFLQLKQEASGWPNECEDNDKNAKENYSRDCLNSFWGKFGQRSNLPNTEIVRTREHLLSLLTSPEHEIINILPINDDVIYVTWRLRQEALVPSSMTNVVIAAYTTAQARLKLYEYLEKLDRRVLYYDTDSCTYVSTGDPNEYEPRTGNFLGDMTDELENHGQGSYIEAFISGGPKFYSYVVRTPQGRTHEVCKVKGITLNFENSRYINFSSIKNLLIAGKITENEKDDEREEDSRKTSINLRFRAIRRTAFHDVVTRDESKSCKSVLLKRRFDNNTGHSLPYGYVAS
ncbi:uncharacterized protein LOC112590523 [Harpegnathos saltator]|uniref:uncharacterized protein LOC112590523 n=1 Tax=Harpegnathos saltator TaxID=610380 RepID=UPI000DBEEEC7|nr:uncharacterized protein LOC112590523 [Harpegnathos saltator]